MAEDAAKVAPHVYKVLFENERVRMLEVSLEPGDRTEMHSHPDYLAYMLSDGKVKFTTPSGETAEVELTAGTSMWREAEEHSTDNVGGPPSTGSSSSRSRRSRRSACLAGGAVALDGTAALCGPPVVPSIV